MEAETLAVVATTVEDAISATSATKWVTMPETVKRSRRGVIGAMGKAILRKIVTRALTCLHAIIAENLVSYLRQFVL